MLYLVFPSYLPFEKIKASIENFCLDAESSKAGTTFHCFLEHLYEARENTPYFCRSPLFWVANSVGEMCIECLLSCLFAKQCSHIFPEAPLEKFLLMSKRYTLFEGQRKEYRTTHTSQERRKDILRNLFFSPWWYNFSSLSYSCSTSLIQYMHFTCVCVEEATHVSIHQDLHSLQCKWKCTLDLWTRSFTIFEIGAAVSSWKGGLISRFFIVSKVGNGRDEKFKKRYSEINVRTRAPLCIMVLLI